MREDLLGDRPEGAVAAGVVGMMVRVYQEFDAFRRLLLQAAGADLASLHVLAVDRDGAAAVDEVADRAAAAGEVADATANLLELGDRRLRRRSLTE